MFKQKPIALGPAPKTHFDSKFHTNAKDLTNTRIGKLTVKSLFGRNKKRSLVWVCLCDCGNEVLRVSDTLIQDKTKSCGCSRNTPEVIALRAQKQIKVDSALRKSYGACKRAAQSRDLIFALELDQFKNLTLQSCFYCGQEPAQIKKTKYENYLANGIDRKDNNLGYIYDNCVPCCYMCNKMKLDYSLSEFLSQCRKIVNMEKTNGTSV